MFQFTHPGRGATVSIRSGSPVVKFQFTHPGRGATDEEEYLRAIAEVSIHAPREGCDLIKPPYNVCVSSFNSRTPGGVRQERKYKPYCLHQVSIHAPREGCDF